MRFRKNSLNLAGLGSTWPESGLYARKTQFINTLISRRRRVIFFALNIVFLTFIWTVLPHHVKQTITKETSPLTRNIPFLQSKTNWRSKEHDKLIGNGTLGFEKIYTIGLADRFDKRDAIELAADVTKLKLTWVDGVPGQAISPKSIPTAFKLPGVPPGVIGCWRSHMNVIQKMVKEKISSALILEDDADWDLHIVNQMQQFSAATKELLSQGGEEDKHAARTNSPYGEGWDILWIGHCGGFQANTEVMPYSIIQNDQTVPPALGIEDMLFGITPWIKWNQTGNDTHCAAHAGRDPEGKVCDSPRIKKNQRIVQERAKPVCTVSYAVSLRGARKMLARLGGISLQDVFAPLDQGMGDICAGMLDLPGEKTRCLTPSPPYIRGHKSRGPMSGDSDIRKTPTGGEKREVGWSKGIMWSTRLNVENIVSGADIEPESQYVRDGPEGKGPWRYRHANEYKAYRPEVVVEEWFWQ